MFEDELLALPEPEPEPAKYNTRLLICLYCDKPYNKATIGVIMINCFFCNIMMILILIANVANVAVLSDPLPVELSSLDPDWR